MRVINVLLVSLTFLSFMLTEWIGSKLIMVALAAWAVFLLCNVSVALRTFQHSGLLVWILPAFAMASTLWSVVPVDTFRSGLQLILSITLALMASRIVSPYGLVCSVFGTTLLASCLSIMFNRYGMDQVTKSLNMAGIFSNKNQLALYTGMLALSGVALLFARQSPRWLRLLAVGGILGGLGISVYARAVGPVVAVLSAASCYGLVLFGRSFQARHRTSYVEMLTLILVVTVVPMAVLVTAFQEDLLRMVGKSPTLTGRTTLWFYAERFKDLHPLLGWGYHGFWVKGQPLAEFLWRIMFVAARAGFHFHSLYYQLLIELGFIGVSLGCIYIVHVLVSIYRYVRSDPGPVSGFFLSYALFILIIQTQGVSLFVTFDASNFLFVAVGAMAARLMSAQPQIRYVPAKVASVVA